MDNESKVPPLQPEVVITLSERAAVAEALARARHLADHLEVGRLLSQLREKVLDRYTAEAGDTVQNQRDAISGVYSYIEKEFGRSRAAVRFYIRCYQRFTESPDSLTLPLRELTFRAAKAAGAA
jgi:hypothetical protein